MKSIILSTLLVCTFFSASLSAETNKTTEELIAEFIASEKRLQEAKAKTAMMKEESAKIKKLAETVDKVAQELAIEKE